MRNLISGLFLLFISTFSQAFFSASQCVLIAEKKNDRCEAVKNCSQRRIDELDQQLLKLNIANEQERSEVVNTKLLKSQAYMYEEKTIFKGVLEITEAYELAKKLPDSEASLSLRKSVLREKGISEFRLGELQNCVDNHNADSCIFPLSENARHKNKYGSTAAINSFMEYMQIFGRDEGLVWLLNIAHQTLGSYPDSVPAQFLFTPDMFNSKTHIGKFTDIAGPLGLQKYSQEAGGVAVDDFNGDGYLDVMFSSLGFCDPTLYFESDGKGGFIDKTFASGVAEVKNNIGIISVDYDNDGDLDVYFSSGGWEDDNYLINLPINYNELYQNNGSGKFIDVTKSVGLRTGRNFTLASIWGDYDNDGFVDLLVCNEMSSPELFRNDHGHFIKTLGMGIVGQKDKRCKSAAWGDVNNDGWLDVFLSYSNSRYEIYINNKGDGFISQQLTLNDNPAFMGFGSYIFDYDNDGWMDIFIANFDGYSKGVQYAPQLAGKKIDGQTMKLFKNMGYGVFWEVTTKVGLDIYLPTMGINFGDANNDGFIDIYTGTSGAALDQIEPNRLFLNINGERFVDATQAAGVGNLQKGHGIAFADFDNDGDQDIFAQFGGAFPGDKFFPSLYQNPGNTNNWITLRLEGVDANRSAIGAKLHFVIETKDGERDIYRVVSHGSTFGSNTLQVEVGLANAIKIKSLSILWRGDLSPEVITEINMNKIVYLKQSTLTPVYLDLKKLNYLAPIMEEHHHSL